MIDILKARIAELEHKKSSKNSSVPPSKDENRKTRSLRKRSEKKIGGQPGHKGTTLKMCDEVDEVIDHEPGYCQGCGHESNDESEHKYRSRRQVIDIPTINPVVTEHRIYECRCCKCGKVNCGEYPQSVDGPVSYGRNISTLISYLSTS